MSVGGATDQKQTNNLQKVRFASLFSLLFRKLKKRITSF